MQVNRKSIIKSRRAWAAALASITAFVPLLDSLTGIDLVALMPVLDNFVNGIFNLAIAGLALGSVVRPDPAGKEPIAPRTS